MTIRGAGGCQGGIVDEDGATTAAREVREETGWQPAVLDHVLSFQPMVGMVDTPHEIYAGRGAELVGEPTDPEEAARFKWVPKSDVFRLIRRRGTARAQVGGRMVSAAGVGAGAVTRAVGGFWFS